MNTKSFLGFLAAVVWFFAPPLAAEPGDLDVTFNGTGKVTLLPAGGVAASANAVAMQPDGRIVLAGYVAFGDIEPPSKTDFLLMRLNANGTLDTRFNGTGIVTCDQRFYDFASSVVVQPDGRILVGGSSSGETDDDLAFAVLRFNANGTRDTTFAGTGQVNLAVPGWPIAAHLALQTDGKVILAGTIWPTSGAHAAVVVLRLNRNGTLDPMFGGTGMITTSFGATDAFARGAAVQPDGKILTGGSPLLRFHADGTLDTSFGNSGVVATPLNMESLGGLALQSDGRILMTAIAEPGGLVGVARYRNYGALDLTFNGTGLIAGPLESSGHAIAVQPDGKIIVAGANQDAGKSNFLVVRYYPNGSLDANFHETGFVLTNFTSESWDTPHALALQPDGRIVVCGESYSNAGNRFLAVARYVGLPSEGTAQFSAPVYLASEKARSAVITVRRIDSYMGTLVVNYEASEGTAASGADFIATSGTLVFGPGQRTKTFRVDLLPDAIADGGETIQLVLKNAAGTRPIDWATLVLREQTLAVSSRRVKPGQRIAVLGKFDRSQPLYVRFTDYGTNDTRVLASDVTARSARVRVPVFIDPAALDIGPAVLAVQSEQGSTVAGPVLDVRVADAPPTGQPPGVFALEFVKAARGACALAEQDWQAIDQQSQGGIDTTELRTALAAMQTRLHEFEDQLQAVLDGSIPEVELGLIDAEQVTVDFAGLSALDRMLVAAVFEGKFKPAAAGSARWRELVAQDRTAAAAQPNGTDDFADELNPKLETKSSGVFALARKVQEVAKTGIGKAAEMAEGYLATPGPPRAELEQAFSATTWFATVLRPALLGYTAAAEAEPVVRNEYRRPVTPADLEAPVEAVHKGFVESIRADNERLARLSDLLSVAGREGTLLWNWVNQSWSELDVPSSIQRGLDWNDPTSAISKVIGLKDVIYEHRPRPVASIEDEVIVVEPDTGRRNASFLVALSFPFDTKVSIYFAVTSGSAHIGSDFAPLANTELVIREGSRGGWINVPVLADNADDEPTEGFGVSLVGAVNATIDPLHAHGSGFILDARRHWTLDATVHVAGMTYPIPAVFDLPRSGGRVTVPLPGVVGKVTVTPATVTVSASGFKFTEGAKVSGGGSGSAPITHAGTSVGASGGITGNVHVLYSDGCEDDFPVTGSFSAMANE